MNNNQSIKEILSRKYHQIGLIFICTSIFFMLIWSATIMMGLNEAYANIFWIFVVCSVAIFLVSLIMGVTLLIITKSSYPYRDLYDPIEKKNYALKYVTFQLIYHLIIIGGLILVLLGLQIKFTTGQILSSIGLLIMGVGIGLWLYNIITRVKYREKTSILGDVISQRGLLSSMSILERLLIFVLILIIAVLSAIQLTEKQKILFEIFLFGFIGLLTILLTFFEIRCKNTIKKSKK